MSWINLDDVEAQLRSKGLVLDKALKFDASHQRWKVDGAKLKARLGFRLRFPMCYTYHLSPATCQLATAYC